MRFDTLALDVRLIAAAVWLIVLGAMPTLGAAAPAELARGGEAKMPIVIADEADEIIQRAARDLGDYLQRISGASFEITTGDGTRGIVLAAPGDFAQLPIEQRFGDEPFDRDHYRLVFTGDALYLLGATPQAVEFAAWDVLHRFGVRQYFPTETWQIVPERDELCIDVDVYEQPAYYNRRGPRGAMRRGHRPWAIEGWNNWLIRNRAEPTFTLHTGHAYLGLIRRNQDAFDENPEFYALVNGKREHIGSTTKICIGNEQLRELVVADAIRLIEQNPQRDSISLDPSDGSNWCDDDCELCAPWGSVSDRVVMLSNQVAEAIEQRFDRPYYIGIYAYNDYSPPPTIDVHPRVIVSLATAFIRGDQTFDDMIEGWSAKAELIGIREYYGVPAWNSSMPGRARASRPEYIARTIADWHQRGARFMNAESDDAWGPNGLGHYVASRALWDVDESQRLDEIIDEFVRKAFGSAHEPMRVFYDTITSSPRISEHLVGTMYRLLAEARELAYEPEQRQRIDELVTYTRYVELHRRFSEVPTEYKQEAFDELMSWVWRTRENMMVDSLGVLNYLHRQQRRTDAFGWAEGYTAVTPSDIHRTDEDKPLSDAEIRAILDAGIANNDTLDFDPVDFGDHLAPATQLNLPEVAPLSRQQRTRGRVENYTWISQPPQRIEIEARTGLIYDNRGPARIILEWWDEDNDEFEQIALVEVPPDQQWHTARFTAEREGLHRIVWHERMTGTQVRWPEGVTRTTPSGMDHANHIWGRDSWYFYVPRGTRVVGAYVSARAGGVYNADGERVFDFDDTGSYNDYLTLEVPSGQDGRLWSVRRLAGEVRLLTVPPFGAGRVADLLLPRDLIEAERARR